ncbi:unnamed protein product, partial [Cladocopium goreaui]
MKGLGIGSLESNQANKRHKPESNGKGKGKTARSTSQETVKVNKDTLTSLTRLVLKEWHQGNKEVPLRHVLATTMMKTLEHRLATLFAAEPTTELYKAVLKALASIIRLMEDPGVTLRFHALKPQQEGCYGWAAAKLPGAHVELLHDLLIHGSLQHAGVTPKEVSFFFCICLSYLGDTAMWLHDFHGCTITGPVVGIGASPLKLPGSNSFGGLSWIWSTYVESLHDAGARVVPLLPQAGREVLLETLQHVDAVLWCRLGFAPWETMELEEPVLFVKMCWPWAKLSWTSLIAGYRAFRKPAPPRQHQQDDSGVHGASYPDVMMDALQAIYQHVSKTSLPLWATCQGFQALCVLASQDPSVVVPTYGTLGTAVSLHFTNEAYQSRLLKDAPETVFMELGRRNSTLNFHSFGVLTESFQHVQGFQVLATDVDSHGQVFASLMEHQHLPIFAAQFHPELYYFLDPHSGAAEPAVHRAIEANSYFMQYFVKEAMKSNVTGKGEALRPMDDYPLSYPPLGIFGSAAEVLFLGKTLKGYVFNHTT